MCTENYLVRAAPSIFDIFGAFSMHQPLFEAFHVVLTAVLGVGLTIIPTSQVGGCSPASECSAVSSGGGI